MPEESKGPARAAQPAVHQPQLTSLQKAELIRGLEIFSRLTVEDLFALAGIAREVEVPAGEVLVRENDLTPAFFILVRGSARLIQAGKSLGRTAGAGHSLGLHSVLTHEPVAFQAVAEEDCLVLSVGAEDFFNFLSTNTEVASGIFKALAEKGAIPTES
jgi:CRP-like cAMP-binding protein